MNPKNLKQIEEKLDIILKRMIVIESLLIRNKHTPLKTLREEALDAADDHYWDPVKYPTVEDSDTVVGESNDHFE